LTTIVVGYTESPEGNAALERAIAEARLRGARLEVVHSRREGHDRDLKDIERYVGILDEIRRRLDAAGVDHAVHDFIQGHSPSEDVVGCATEIAADLIIIGLRHRTKTGKYLLGSVAQDILLDAPCAVLAVKADQLPT
jgi:nucleotide-binding universal stress UspA family protein